MPASLLAHSLPRCALVGLARAATPLALGRATASAYPTWTALGSHIGRSISTSQSCSIGATAETKSKLKVDGELQRASEGPHFSDLQHSAWKSTRPHEDWTAKHSVYTSEEVNSVEVVRHTRTTTTDRLASGMVKLARWGFDTVTRYKHSSPEAAREALVLAGKQDLSVEQLQQEGYIMTKDQWMARILFLESIAGVPGMCAAVIRHLRSLRLMKRDGGWISTLLQEAENERMHLLTFMKIGQPSLFFRLLVLAHRFVGYLEEEAVLTYTNIVNEIKRGNIPEWGPGKQAVPDIAKDYWRLGHDATMLDLVLAVRADEASHRFTNHTLANLNQDDFNPLAMKHAPPEIEGTTDGFTREQSKAWLEDVERELKPCESQAKKEGLDK